MNRKYLIIVLIIVLIPCVMVNAQRVRNTYKFYNSLSTTEADCAEDLIPTQGLCLECQSSTAPTPGYFVQDILSPSAINRTVYHNNLNWGLKYLNTDGVISKTYTVQLYLRVVNFNKFYTRIIDFSDGAEDDGLYFTNYFTPPPTKNRCLNFYPNGNFGICPYFNDTTYYLLTITRNGATKIIDIYVNDRLFTSYNDVTNFYTGSAGKPIHIFRDDPIGFACEDGEANFAYLSFANFYSTIDDVALVYNNISVVANSADFSFPSVAKCAGKNITINYTGDIPATSNQYKFQWNWDGGTVVSGTGRGPYVVNWTTTGTKTITLDISGGACGTAINNSKQISIGKESSSVIDTSICTGDFFEGHSTSGTYTSTIVTASGCDSIHTVHLTVKPCSIFFPTGFTPNKNGKNETFKLLGDNFVSQYNLKVYNRYGEIVFQTSDPRIGWDGRFKGRDVDMGVYVWFCYLKQPNTDHLQLFKGTVTLFR